MSRLEVPIYSSKSSFQCVLVCLKRPRVYKQVGFESVKSSTACTLEKSSHVMYCNCNEVYNNLNAKIDIEMRIRSACSHMHVTCTQC
jgi:hypothetical protein